MNIKLIALIAGAVLAAIIAGVAYVVLGGDDDTRRAGALTRSYTAGNVGLEVDGVQMGFVKSVTGCDVTVPVVLVNTTEGTQKQSGAAKYTPCTIAFGLGMKPAFFQWISDSLAGKALPKNVAIVVFNFEYKPVSRLELAGANITRFVTPALAGASTDVVYFEATLSANSIRRATPSGTAGSPPKAKLLLASNYRLTAPGLDGDLKKVAAVDAWSFEVKPAEAGELKVSALGRPELGDLVLSVNAPTAEFDLWLEGVMKGNASEKPLSLTYMDQTLTIPLVDLSFAATGLTEADLLGTTEGSFARRHFSMYVEGATIKFNSAAVG